MSIQNMKREQKGSALILVIIVTVLLSVVGIMFVMTMRMREMTTANITDDRDLDTAVEAVTEKIDTVLLQDLFGTGTSIVKTSNSYNDLWLASLEPGVATWTWPSITDLSGGAVTPALTWGKTAIIIPDYQAASIIQQGNPADADGDGVADSMWIQLADYTKTPSVPLIFTSKGKPVFAAVRIIDNCAMLNLNTAFGFYQDLTNTNPWYLKTWYEAAAHLPPMNLPYCPQFGDKFGRYLDEINYGPFLRAQDIGHIERLRLGRDPIINPWKPAQTALTCQDYHKNVVMEIESPGTNYTLFDVGDELEIRNRFLLTSKGISRFEKRHADTESRNATPPVQAYSGTMYYTFDLGRGIWGNDSGAGYPKARVPSIPFTTVDFQSWKNKVNSQFFDYNPPPDAPPTDYEYDRRHICTFYSFDRNIRSGSYLLLDAALQTIPAAQRRTTEELFRPLDYRPIDLRTITDTANPDNITADTPGSRRNILTLLYAFREYCFEDIKSEGAFSNPAQIKPLAARKAAQMVANMIDYLDMRDPVYPPTAATGPFAGATYGLQKDDNPTYINKAIIDAMILEVSGNDPAVVGNAAFDFGLAATDTLYGYERQPFISEVYCENLASGITEVFALELVNPYDTPISLNGWRLCFGTSGTSCTLGSACTIPAALPGTQNGRLIIWTADTAGGYSAPAITTDAVYNTIISPTTANGISNTTFGLGTPMQLPGNELRLQRPDPANAGQFLTEDKISDGQRAFLRTAIASILDTCRKEADWGFVNMMAYPGSPTPTVSATPTLGDVNIAASVPHTGYALPVADTLTPLTSLGRLADFQKITFVGNGDDPNCITSLIADAYTKDGESDVRFDYLSFPPMLEYVCTLNRPEGNLPGRININTAPKHVIAAAIPPQLVMTSLTDPNDALAIAGQIVSNRPYTDLGGMLTKVPAMKKYADPIIVPNVGEPGIRGDFEERDWIINRLSNIFTVRSDTFTAYILVRLGTDGPQRRMIAVFDRSNCWSASDKPKLVALHPVPDPR
jgi:hypothetical protein